MAKGHKKIIEESIRKRGDWTRDGANDPGIDYYGTTSMVCICSRSTTREHIIRMMAKHGDAATAAQVALNEFKYGVC